MNYHCIECQQAINYSVFQYSTEKIGIPLCISHQKWLSEIEQDNTISDEALDLYFELKARGVPAELEKHDGYKHIDIAIPSVKVNLEVDGRHHTFNARQALSDLQRTYHSFRKGYLTLRIPNALVRYHLEEAADFIVDFLMENQKRLTPLKWKYRNR